MATSSLYKTAKNAKCNYIVANVIVIFLRRNYLPGERETCLNAGAASGGGAGRTVRIV